MDDALVDAVTAAERDDGPATLAACIEPQVRRALVSDGLAAYRHFVQAWALTEAGIERAERVHAARVTKKSRDHR